MSSLAEKDFEDLRVHFSERKWKKLKEVEKIIYLNQKSNHLFKLSVGLTSKVPEFMRTSADPAPEESDHPPPVKKVKRVKKEHHSAEFTSNRDLRIRTNVVDYKEPTKHEWEEPLKKPRKKRVTMKYKKKRKEKTFRVHCVLTETVLDRSLRNRAKVVNYTEVQEDGRAPDQGTSDSAPQPSEDDDEWKESGDEESIPSDEESTSSDESDSTDQETSAPQPRKKKKRGEKSEDEESIPSDKESGGTDQETSAPQPSKKKSEDDQSIPSDEESGDATETTKVGSPRVTLSRLSADRIKAKMHQETSAPQPSKEEEEESEDEQTIPSDETGGTDQETSAPQPSKEEEESEDEQTIPSDEESGDATETVKVVSPRVTRGKAALRPKSTNATSRNSLH